jgi:hypothetical protein
MTTIFVPLRTSTVDVLRDKHKAAYYHYAASQGIKDPHVRNPARSTFTIACQNAASLIQERIGQESCKASAGFHVLCSSTPPDSAGRADIGGVPFDNVLDGVMRHLEEALPLEVALAPVLARPTGSYHTPRGGLALN